MFIPFTKIWAMPHAPPEECAFQVCHTAASGAMGYLQLPATRSEMNKTFAENSPPHAPSTELDQHPWRLLGTPVGLGCLLASLLMFFIYVYRQVKAREEDRPRPRTKFDKWVAGPCRFLCSFIAFLILAPLLAAASPFLVVYLLIKRYRDSRPERVIRRIYDEQVRSGPSSSEEAGQDIRAERLAELHDESSIPTRPAPVRVRASSDILPSLS